MRYFFDVNDGGHFSDDDGAEFDNMPSVEREATKNALAIAREHLHPDEESLSVDVRDNTGRAVLKVTVSLAIKRLDVQCADVPVNDATQPQACSDGPDGAIS